MPPRLYLLTLCISHSHTCVVVCLQLMHAYMVCLQLMHAYVVCLQLMHACVVCMQLMHACVVCMQLMHAYVVYIIIVIRVCCKHVAVHVSSPRHSVQLTDRGEDRPYMTS